MHLFGGMQLPIDITFRDMPTSAALETTINECARKLEHVYPVQRCAVIIETPHKHHRHGRAFKIQLTVTLPGHVITVSRPGHDNAYLAISDAFRIARRQLVDFVAQRREARPVA